VVKEYIGAKDDDNLSRCYDCCRKEESKYERFGSIEGPVAMFDEDKCSSCKHQKGLNSQDSNVNNGCNIAEMHSF
jgi:hypothetical protein